MVSLPAVGASCSAPCTTTFLRNRLNSTPLRAFRSHSGAHSNTSSLRRKQHHLRVTRASSFSPSNNSRMDDNKVAQDVDGSTAGEATEVFVAGSTGNTGRRIVRQLLSRGFRVRAGALDVDRARSVLPSGDPNLEIVRADVTEDPERIAAAVGSVHAVICATGFRRSWDPFAPWKVDNFGTVNLVKACSINGVSRFILVSSILVNGAAMGQILNPAYVILNVLGLTLIAKLQAENYIRKCGINYTIIRPGGLRDYSPSGNVIMEAEDTLYEGSISREQVAEVAIEALLCPDSSYKVVEIICRSEAPKRLYKDLFSSVAPKG